MSLCAWFGVFPSSFPKLPQYCCTCEIGITWHTEGPDTRAKSYLMWNKELKVICPCTWFGVFEPSFPKLPQYICPIALSTCEAGIIRPTECLDTSVMSHLMWNKELKPLDFFSFDSVLDSGVFGSFPSKFPKYPKNRYNSIVGWSW